MKRFKTLEELQKEYGNDLYVGIGYVTLAYFNCRLGSACFGKPVDQVIEGRDLIEDWMVTEDSTHDGQGYVKPQCECGAEIAGSFHSDWCPMYRSVWK